MDDDNKENDEDDSDDSSAKGNGTSTPVNTLHVSRSAERSLHLLDTVVGAGSLNLSEAAAATDMAPSTALRHLRALVGSGWLSRDDLGRFSSGPTLLRVALGAFRAGPYARVAAAAQPHLEQLVEATEESAYLAVRDGTQAVYIATVESSRAIRHVGWVGRSAPIDGTAIGAALTDELLTPGAAPSVHCLTGTIEPDVTAVTAPIHGPTQILAALSILGPSDRLADDRRENAEREIANAARALSLELSTVVVGEDETIGGRHR